MGERMTVEDAAMQLNVMPELLLGLATHGQIPFVKDPLDRKRIMFDQDIIQNLSKTIALQQRSP